MVNRGKFFIEETSQEAQQIKDSLLIFSEELLLAKKWNRPSLLIAIYKSEYVREYAEALLEDLVKASQDSVVRHIVKKGRFDIPVELRGAYPSREDTIFFISGLRWGGGKSARNAYRALNVRREILIEEKIRAVFWLTETEAHGLPRFAPDFWAFRHRAIKIDDFYVQSFRTLSLLEMNFRWHGDVEKQTGVGDVEDSIQRAASLTEAMQESNTGTRDLAECFQLAYTLWKNTRYQEALALLEQALKEASRTQDATNQIKLLSGMGIVLYGLQEFDRSIDVMGRASVLNLEDEIVRNNLSMPLYRAGYVDKALDAIREAIKLGPKHPKSWRTLGSLYFDLGYFDDARLALQRSVKYEPQDPLAWFTLATIFSELGRSKQALHAFRKAHKIDASYAIPGE